MSVQDQWETAKLSKSPTISKTPKQTRHFLGFRQWPQLDDYRTLFSQSGIPVQPVAQAGEITRFEEQYEPRVFLKQEIQTRTENWHDFFQFLTWFMFPKTKAVINAIHIPAAQLRIEEETDLGRRSPIENMLS